jgi:Ni/Fe-hydrogenase subunit HybB-like protein
MGGHYFPSPWEWLVTLGMWSILILGYLFIIENFSILPKEEHAEEVAVSHGASVGKGVPSGV